MSRGVMGDVLGDVLGDAMGDATGDVLGKVLGDATKCCPHRALVGINHNLSLICIDSSTDIKFFFRVRILLW